MAPRSEAGSDERWSLDMNDLLTIRQELLAFLEARTGSRELAEDTLQAAFVRCIEKRATLRRNESIVPWFYALLVNVLLDTMRRRAVEARGLETISREYDVHLRSPADLERQTCLCILRLVETLKPEYQRALRAIDIDGGALVDLARREGISVSNAGVRVHRARRALARRVRAVCGPCADRKCVDCTCTHRDSGRPLPAQGEHGADRSS
jgi:RNA polymerase sigma-70 factor (ECF subfamily)